MNGKKSTAPAQGDINNRKQIIAKPVVSLNPQESLTVNLFNKYGVINQFIATDAGIMRLAARVRNLKDKKAVISTVKRDVFHEGKWHPRVAFYRLLGWEA